MRWLVLCVHLKCACDAADCSCNVSFLLSQEFCLCVYTVIRHTSVCWGTAGGVFSHDCHTLTLLKWLMWRHYSAFNHGANEWSKEKTRVQVSVFLQVSLLNQLFLIDVTYLLKRMCRVFTWFWTWVIHPRAGLETNRSCNRNNGCGAAVFIWTSYITFSVCHFVKHHGVKLVGA